jgi:preprotein translocase subunit SecD
MTWLISFIAKVCVFVIVSAGPGHADVQGAGWRDWLIRIFSSGSDSEPDAALKRLGGSRLVLKLDPDVLRREVLDQLQQDVRALLREGRVPYQGLAVQGGSVELRIVREGDRQPVAGKLAQLWTPAGASGGSVDVQDLGDGLIRLTPTESAFVDRLQASRQRSIHIIAKRLEAFGVVAPVVRPAGPDRIVALAPGITDPELVRAMLYKQASLTFRLVDTSMTPDEALERGPPPGSEILHERNGKMPYLVAKQDAMRGGAIIEASPGYDERTREPIVHFRFDAAGTRRFAQVTQENVGRPFAVVLDGDVISAPIIREPILKGSGQVSGSFTLEEANALAVLLSTGILPASVTIIDQQVVEPATKSGQR